MSRFPQIFARAATERRCALIPYITVGDPSVEESVAIACALAEAGADIIELGVPFSDPVADGAVIQAASERALAAHTRLSDVIAAAARIRRHSPVGLLLFSYYNPVLRFGVEAFAQQAAAAGCDGVLITDLIPEEAVSYRTTVQQAGLDTVFLAAPTSPDARLRAVAEASSGFVYAIARLGVTGAQTNLDQGAAGIVERLRRQMDTAKPLPIALGFGLSRAEQVRQVAGFAEGAVVGTALVDAIAKAGTGQKAQAAANFLTTLLAGREPHGGGAAKDLHHGSR